MDWIFASLYTFLAILGFVDVIRLMIFKFFKIGRQKSSIIPITNSDDAEFTLRKKCAEAKWNDSETRLICLNYSNEEDTEKILKIASGDYDFIDFYNIKDSGKKKQHLLD
ncbi:MAG: hypothetical protein LBP36_00675 [Oscillospiraceae bacterium]|jgi:hypothetical protein|nr:hypothetical protein [Oscillospiraceae bacterium]